MFSKIILREFASFPGMKEKLSSGSTKKGNAFFLGT
jgi:hypothetical protein